MFFIFGLFLGAFIGAIALLGVSVPLLLLRRFGLVWGDRRIWWTLAAGFAVAIGLFFSAASHQFKESSDSLEKGFVQFQSVGVVVGIVLFWAIGLIVLSKWGSKWKPSVPGVSQVASISAIVAMAFAAKQFATRPNEIREQRASNREEWVSAVKAADAAQIEAMAKAGHAEWGNVQELGNDPMGYAFRNGDLELFTVMLRLRPYGEDTGRNAARRVGGGNSMKFLKLVLAEFENDPAVVDECLCSAVFNEHREIYDYLFENHDADANAVTTQSALMMAAVKGRLKMAKDLIKRGAEVTYLNHATQYSPGESALQGAIHLKQPAMLTLLLENDANPDLCHPGSPSPLMRAVELKNEAMVRELLEAGASLEVKDKKGNTALHVACRGPKINEPMTRILLEAGADPSIANVNGFVPATRIPPELIPEKND